MDNLPVDYTSNKKAWFTGKITKDCFFDQFVPAVQRFQRREKNRRESEATALLLLDNAPAHPSEAILCTPNGKIRTMFLPPNTTSILQPMDQGIINAFKRHYRRLMLEDILIVELEPDEGEDRRGKRSEC